MMALISLELLLIQKMIYAENLDKTDEYLKAMESENFRKLVAYLLPESNYADWISSALDKFRDGKRDDIGSSKGSISSSDSSDDEK